MSQIFFTADLHFSHANILKFCPRFRPAADVAEMDELLINYWNSTVQSNDIVYNLGDLSFSHDRRQISQILSRLNGEHHLILGNHDDIITQHLSYFLSQSKADGKPLLASVQHYLELPLAPHKPLVLCHYPISEWNGCHKGWTHLHGHLHERSAGLKGRVLNVGFDTHGRFLTSADIAQLLDKVPALKIPQSSGEQNLRQSIEQLNGL